MDKLISRKTYIKSYIKSYIISQLTEESLVYQVQQLEAFNLRKTEFEKLQPYYARDSHL